jgi:uncharacterized membrane protein (UPF0127 family)
MLLLSITALIIITILAYFMLESYLTNATNAAHYKSFTVNNQTFNFTYVAVTEKQLEAGLMNKTVTNSTFMLFVFPASSIYPFWMFNTYYNLDIIWVNSSSVQTNANSISAKVVYVQQNATPCLHGEICVLYTPTNKSDFVIEAQSGFAKAHDVAIGSKLQINK